MRAAKICFIGLMVVFPVLTAPAFAERLDDAVAPKTVVGDENSDAMATSSLNPVKEMSCNAEKLGIKTATTAFNMTYAFGEKLDGFQEPSP